MKVIVYLTILGLIIFTNGCASFQWDVSIVKKTLATYQVGKTTFADFQRDADLTESPPSAPQKSYLNPHPVIVRPEHDYTTPPSSVWKIYESGEKTNAVDGTRSHIVQYVVGDFNHPISILTFDGQGKLIEITPVP